MNQQIIEKTCTRCGKSKPADIEHFPWREKKNRLDSWCRQCYRDNTNLHHAKDPELKRQKDRDYRRSQGEAYYARKRLRYQSRSLTARERAKIRARRHNEKLKREAMDHYGGAICCCCGETEILMLSLDHIAGDGAAHRKSLTGSTHRMAGTTHGWAKANGYPPIFQVLCMNCNWARHWNNGVCPHESRRQELTAIEPASDEAGVLQPQAA